MTPEPSPPNTDSAATVRWVSEVFDWLSGETPKMHAVSIPRLGDVHSAVLPTTDDGNGKAVVVLGIRGGSDEGNAVVAALDLQDMAEFLGFLFGIAQQLAGHEPGLPSMTEWLN